MRLSLSQQFVMATVGLTSLVLVATLALARWSFQSGFASYVDALERRRLESIGELLLEYYDPALGWSGLTRRQFVAALLRRPEIAAERRAARPAPPIPGGEPPRQGERPPPSLRCHPPGARRPLRQRGCRLRRHPRHCGRL